MYRQSLWSSKESEENETSVKACHLGHAFHNMALGYLTSIEEGIGQQRGPSYLLHHQLFASFCILHAILFAM